MNRAFVWIVVGLLGLGPQLVFADTIFSFYGLGDMVRRIDARSRAMGGAGRALVDGQNFSTNNPALVASFVRPSVSAQFFAQRRMLSGGGAINDGDVGTFQMVLPVSVGTVVSVGFDPLTDMDFGAVDTVASGGQTYQSVLDASGGVQAISLCVAQRFGNQWYLGGRLDWVAMGTINETWIKAFEGTELFDSRDVVNRTHRGWLPSFGIVYTPDRHWSVGGHLQIERSIRQRQILTTRWVAESAAVKIETRSHEQLPYLVGAGVVYQAGYRWLAAADAERAFWGQTGAGRFNTWDLSAGVMLRTGSPDPLAHSRRIEFNAGMHYRTLYFPTLSGSQIGEIGASFGVALPLKNQSGRFRYGIEVGTRGDRNKHGNSEKFVLQTLSITGFFQ